MIESWIKLFPKIKEWKWYKDDNTFRLFIHCLLSANWKNGTFQNIEIPRGSFITSLGKLSEELNLSKQQIRTALEHLQATQEITQQSTHSYSVITVVNYDKYQYEEKIATQQSTHEVTTIEDIYNNSNNNREKNILDILIFLLQYTKFNDNTSEQEDIFTFYEKNFGRTIAPVEYQSITTWQEYFPDDVIKKAITIAIENSVLKLSYINRILQIWKDAGYKNLDQIIQNQQFKKNKKGDVDSWDLSEVFKNVRR